MARRRSDKSRTPSMHPRVGGSAELPNDVDSEKATLGSILMNREAITSVAQWLKPDMFYLSRHAMIYDAMLSLFKQRIPPDTKLVAAELDRRGHMDAIGGLLYLVDLVDSVPTSYHIEFYGRNVERAAKMRQLIDVGGRVATMGFNQENDPDACIREGTRLLAGIQAGSRALIRPMREYIDSEYERLSADSPDSLGFRTGWQSWDQLVQMHKGDFVVIGARPGMGKSATAISLIAQLAQNDYACLLWSLEMSNQQVTQRALSGRANVPFGAIRDGQLPEHWLKSVVGAMGEVSAYPIYLMTEEQRPVEDLYLAIQEMRALEPDRELVVFVDYLQLATTDEETDNRYQEVSHVSRCLKAYAKELDVLIIALAQVGRAVEQRQTKVPTISDLRESGQIEADADVIMFLYREEVYDQNTDKRGIVEVHIAKHRNGPLGIIIMRFEASSMRIMEITYRTVEGYDEPAASKTNAGFPTSDQAQNPAQRPARPKRLIVPDEPAGESLLDVYKRAGEPAPAPAPAGNFRVTPSGNRVPLGMFGEPSDV